MCDDERPAGRFYEDTQEKRNTTLVNFMPQFRSINALEKYLYTVPRARTHLLRKEDLSLSPIRKLLNDVGNPEKRFPIVYVWGTSGKGSTVTFLSSILKASGLRVGHILSPHVDHIRERCQINGKWISVGDFLSVGNAVLAAAEKRAKREKFEPSFFEVITAMELLALSKAKVDIAVVEVGLGGAYDATAICPRILSILTNLDLEHRNVLGYTLSQTARKESELIKPGVPLITQEEKSVPLKIIRAVAQKRRAPLTIIPQETSFRIVLATLKGTLFNAQTKKQHYNNLSLRLPGQYQISNALTAIVAAEILQSKGFPINEKSIRKGLKSAYIPGRFEVRKTKPLLIFDGAHNPAKARALSKSWKALLPKVRPTIVLTIKPKKEIRGMVRAFSELTDHWVVTDVPDDVMIPMERLKKIIREVQPHARIQAISDPLKAYRVASVGNKPVLVTGSLYLVSFLRQHL